MEKIDKAIEILQAFKDGKTIEYRVDIESDVPYNHWITTTSFGDIMLYLKNGKDIRIKPEPKYRPYNNAEEFLKATIQHGDWIHVKNDSCYYKILRCSSTRVSIASEGPSYVAHRHFIYYEDLYEGYIFSDGSVCGVKEE